MKKVKLFLTTCLACLLMMCTTQLKAQWPPAGGDGTTAGTAWQIMTDTDLADLATWVNAGNSGAGQFFALGTNIDLTSYLAGAGNNAGAGWIPIGTDANQFSGNFNGNNNTITGLYINRPGEDYMGLFGRINGATIENLGVIAGNVLGGDFCGGIIGRSVSSTITNCYFTGDVEGRNGVTFSGGYVGGLIGHSNLGIIADCYAQGTVKGDTWIGGLAGVVSNGTVDRCYAESEVYSGVDGGSGGFAGGIGRNITVTSCYSNSKVISEGFGVGGFAGWIWQDAAGSGNVAVVQDCYALGYVEGELDPTTPLGSVAGSHIGGFIGRIAHEHLIQNCYTACQIVVMDAGTPVPMSPIPNGVGGFAGLIIGAPGTINNCYFDSDVADLTNCYDGTLPIGGTCNCSGLPTYQMVKSASYTGWGIPSAIWRQYTGVSYPYLTANPEPVYPSFTIPCSSTGIQVNVSDNTITYTGECSGVSLLPGTPYIQLDIPAGMTVEWYATLTSGVTPVTVPALVYLGNSLGIFDMKGGKISRTAGGACIQGANGSTIIISDGIVEHRGTNDAILTNGASSKVYVNGGQVIATTGYAISAAGSGPTYFINGGLLFAYDKGVIPPANVLLNVVTGDGALSNTLVPQNDAMIIAWDNSTPANMPYAIGSSTDINIYYPATDGIAYWDSVGGAAGIVYSYDGNAGFIPLPVVLTMAPPYLYISPSVTLACGAYYEITAELTANSYADTVIVAKIALVADILGTPFPAATDSVTIEYYYPATDSWIPLAFDASGVCTFPTGGFVLEDTVATFRVSNNGNVESDFGILVWTYIENLNGDTLTDFTDLMITVLAKTSLDTANFPAALACDVTHYFDLISYANCYVDTMIMVNIELSNPLDAALFGMEYNDGGWQPVTFTAGVASIGPFPLTDYTVNARISNAGTVTTNTDVGMTISIVKASDETVLATIDLSTTVYITEVTITSTDTVACPGFELEMTATPTGGTWSSSDEWVATIDPVTGVLTSIAFGTTVIAYTYNNGFCDISAVQTVTVTAPNTIMLTSAPGTDNQTMRAKIDNTRPITTITYATTGITGLEDATGLPAGVTATWASNVITISGIPTEYDVFNYTIFLTGGCGIDTVIGTITVLEPCPFTMPDDVNTNYPSYDVVDIDGKCWNKENFRGYLYQDGSEILPIPVPYYTTKNPDSAQYKLDIGLLYTYAAAFPAPVTFPVLAGKPMPEADFATGAREICPDGWRIATVEEWSALIPHDTRDLKNPLYWLQPNDDTNALGFDVRGAGFYNSATQRFENITGYAAFWSSAAPSATTCFGAVFRYNCNMIDILEIPLDDAISIRCIMVD